MLLRDDKQEALNRVENLCLESADAYEASAARCSDPELAALFEQAREARLELAAALAPHIRALGDLPSAPDPDRETVGHAVDTLRAYLSSDGDATLLEQRLDMDAALEEAARAALAESLPEETRALLDRALQTLGASRTRMLNARH